MLPNRHISEKAEIVTLGNAVEDPRYALDLLVIRGDPKTYESERRRQSIEHVYTNMKIVLLQEILSCIESSRSGADDCCPERIVSGPESRGYDLITGFSL